MNVCTELQTTTITIHRIKSSKSEMTNAKQINKVPRVKPNIKRWKNFHKYCRFFFFFIKLTIVRSALLFDVCLSSGYWCQRNDGPYAHWYSHVWHTQSIVVKRISVGNEFGCMKHYVLFSFFFLYVNTWSFFFIVLHLLCKLKTVAQTYR